jgi:hypothetical protein
MDIYLAIGFAPLVLGIVAISRLRTARYLLVVAGALALSGCLSLKFGSNDKPRPIVGQSAGPVGQRARPVGQAAGAGTLDVANSMAEASGS